MVLYFCYNRLNKYIIIVTPAVAATTEIVLTTEVVATIEVVTSAVAATAELHLRLYYLGCRLFK